MSALISAGTAPDRLYQAWLRGDIEVLTSGDQIAELREVFARDRIGST